MTKSIEKDAPASPEARTAYVLERAGGACEYRTEGCTGVATDALVDGAWRAFGKDDAPAWALHACCETCREKWAR